MVSLLSLERAPFAEPLFVLRYKYVQQLPA